MINSVPHLTNNAIYDIMINKTKVKSVVLQIIQIKEMRASVKKYKLALSDGEYYTSSILNSQLNSKIECGDLQTNSIVILSEYHLMGTLDKDILVIKNIEPVCLFSSVIGSPSNIISISSQNSQNFDINNNNSSFIHRNVQENPLISSQNTNSSPPALRNSQNTNIDQKIPPDQINLRLNDPSPPQQKFPSPPRSSQIQFHGQSANQSQNISPKSNSLQNRNYGSEQSKLSTFFNATQNTARRHAYIDIDVINPYINRWTILARVIMKSSIINFIGRDGKPGKFFNVTLKDKTGSEIRGTFFNDQVTIFEPIIEQDKVYEISGGIVKEKDPRFNSTPHDYEISFNSTTRFVQMPDDHKIGKLTYQFKKLAELPNIPPKSTVDIIAYVVSIGEIQSLALKDNRSAEKRDIVICDDSNVKCDMTLWDKEARDFPNEPGFIVAFKEAKLSDFKGRTLSSSSICVINPSFPEAHRLQSWINQCISDPNFDFNSIATVSNGGDVNRSFIFLSQINDLHLGTHEKPDYGNVIVTLSDVFVGRKIYYAACPNPECKFKGLSITNADSFFCEKCQRIVENPVYRYIFSIKAQDFTGSTVMSFVGDDQIGALFTGMNANEWHNETDGYDEIQIRQILQEKFFMTLKLKCRIKTDNYNNRSFVKTNIMSGQYLNYADGAKFFANEINKYS